MSTASVADSARIAGLVLGPALAQGVIRRRPSVTAYAARHELDARAADVLREMRRRYGSQPLRLRVPGRDFAVVLDPADVHDLLTRTPDPFSPATTEKTASLRHFQPHGVLVSRGRERAPRRVLNERALDAEHEHHRYAKAFTDLVERETEPLNTFLDKGNPLDWRLFAGVWWRVVRQITFGPAARDDRRLTAELGRLRSDANWAYLRPRRTHRRERFELAIRRYAADPDPHSLMAYAPDESAGQVPHWLFAFDAAGATAYRALALLATHPEAAERTDDEDFLRACVLDTVRLYPTTLVILRQAVQAAIVGGTPIPDGASLIIHSGFFHRDPVVLGDLADRFAPAAWLDGTAPAYPGLVPFSDGPARCPGRNLVELTASAVLAVLGRGPLRLRACAGRAPSTREPLPASLDHFTVRLSRPASAYAG